jgi:tol-pal system protein YbgF
VGEQADFSRAQEALATGDFRSAADLLATFGATYPGSPISQEAQLLRGKALDGLGDMAAAARAFLEAFSGNPQGRFAPEALVKLGVALGAVGQTQDGCITLAEVAVRFPGDPSVLDSQSAMRELGCQ